MRYLLVGLLVLSAAPVSAQSRTVVEIGSGSFSAGDPFSANLRFRSALGRIVGARDLVALEYSRQRANRGEGDALGLIARDFLALGWHHAFREAFSHAALLKQQYLLHLNVGIVPRRRFPEAVGNDRLKAAPFLGIGVAIRYPVTRRLALLGTLDDALVFLSRQTVRSYCPPDGGSCYSPGSAFFFDVDVGGAVQQNFGFFVSLQARL